MTEQDAKVEEALRKLDEANKKLAASRASQTTTPAPHKTDKSFIGILKYL
jgi:hypothetical protein